MDIFVLKTRKDGSRYMDWQASWKNYEAYVREQVATGQWLPSEGASTLASKEQIIKQWKREWRKRLRRNE